MFLKILRILTLVFLFISSAFAATSDPRFDTNSIRVDVTGKITKDDLLAFKRIDSALVKITDKYPDASMNFIVGLNSEGGGVDSAIEIGRLMRKNNAVVIIAQPWKCFSSCVYLLAGASQRLVYGKVGIHRPYKLDDKVTLPAAQKTVHQEIDKVIKAYLEEVNVSVTLYDDSIRVPPEKNKILTDDELSKYGLNEDDPYYHDALISKFSKSLGITSSEYIERLARKNSICKQFEFDGVKAVDCYIKIVNEGRLSYE